MQGHAGSRLTALSKEPELDRCSATRQLDRWPVQLAANQTSTMFHTTKVDGRAKNAPVPEAQKMVQAGDDEFPPLQRDQPLGCHRLQPQHE